MKAPFWLFVTDPWETLDHANDTTLRLMEAAVGRRVNVFWADVRTVRWEDGEVLVDALAFSKADLAGARSEGNLPPSAIWSTKPTVFKQIHYRVDPPVDLAYIHPLQMLTQRARKRLVNPPDSLLLFSEKTLAAEVPELFPRTCVSSIESVLMGFLAQEGQVVLKPLHQAQSKGVKLLNHDLHADVHSALRAMTESFARPVLLQEYLPAVAEAGETRLWFVDGILIAAAQKIPARGQFVIDMDRGGSISRAKLSPQDRAAARKIGALLKKHRIRLAAVDWISGKITDFNITSPGLIVPMEKLLKQNLASKIVAKLMR